MTQFINITHYFDYKIKIKCKICLQNLFTRSFKSYSGPHSNVNKYTAWPDAFSTERMGQYPA